MSFPAVETAGYKHNAGVIHDFAVAKSKEPAGRRRYGRALKPFGDAKSTAILLVAGRNRLAAIGGLVEEGVDIGLGVEGD